VDAAGALSEYLEEIRAISPMTREEMAEKLAIARDGSEVAKRVRDEVIEGCLEVTALLALHLAPPWISDIDAVQEANQIFMELVDDLSVSNPVEALTPAIVKLFRGMKPWSGTLEEVFERFTDRARRVLVLAQEEARLLNHSFIGTEHILLGLIAEREGVAAKALQDLGISLEAVREKVEETIGMGGTAPSGSPPFTPRAKKVLELALRETMQLGHGYIGTEHLLLGLVREGEGVAPQVLVSLGADLGRVRREVIKLISGGQEPHIGRAVKELDATTEAWWETSEPLCPRCRASVTSEARFRTIEVSPDAGNPSPMPILVVYCMQCGTTLHMFKAEGSS
jgi:hypothetical protein